MKLNYRDKIILGVLLAVVILLLGFFLLIKPKKADIESDKATLTQVQQQKDEIDAKIAEIKPLQKQIKETYDDTTKLTGDFVAYNDINNPRKIDQYMQHFCEDCEVKTFQRIHLIIIILSLLCPVKDSLNRLTSTVTERLHSTKRRQRASRSRKEPKKVFLPVSTQFL